MAKAAMKTPPAAAATPRRKFSDEFKEAAVARVKGGESVASVAKEIGIGPGNLYIWKANIEGDREHETPDLTRPHEGGVPAGASRALVKEVALLNLELKFMRDREALLQRK